MAHPKGFNKLGSSIGNLGESALGALKTTGQTLFGGAGKSGAVGANVVGKTGGLITGLASGIAGSVGSVINGTASTIKMFPRTTVGLAVVAGGLAVKNRYDRKRMAADEAYTQAQMMAAQPQQSPYMNSVTPQETAELNARMREGEQPRFEAAMAAQRAQEQPQPAVKA